MKMSHKLMWSLLDDYYKINTKEGCHSVTSSGGMLSQKLYTPARTAQQHPYPL